MKARSHINSLVAAFAIGAMSLAGSTSASAEASALSDSRATTASASRTDGNDTTDTPGADGSEAKSSATVTPQCVVCGAPVKKAVKVSGPVLVQKKFVKYLTMAWAKSTGYSWNTSTTVNSSITAGLGITAPVAASNIGATVSVTRDYSITINIAASSSKYSKLGLASNYNRYRVKTAYFQNGKPFSGATWTYGDLYTPTKDQYLVVYYQ